MPTLIEVFEPGGKVYVGHDPADIRGEVIEFMVSGADLAVSYHVAWWEGRTRRKEWLEACEVRQAPESRTMQVGFKGLNTTSPEIVDPAVKADPAQGDLPSLRGVIEPFVNNWRKIGADWDNRRRLGTIQHDDGLLIEQARLVVTEFDKPLEGIWLNGEEFKLLGGLVGRALELDDQSLKSWAVHLHRAVKHRTAFDLQSMRVVESYITGNEERLQINRNRAPAVKRARK